MKHLSWVREFALQVPSHLSDLSSNTRVLFTGGFGQAWALAGVSGVVLEVGRQAVLPRVRPGPAWCSAGLVGAR